MLNESHPRRLLQCKSTGNRSRRPCDSMYIVEIVQKQKTTESLIASPRASQSLFKTGRAQRRLPEEIMLFQRHQGHRSADNISQNQYEAWAKIRGITGIILLERFYPKFLFR